MGYTNAGKSSLLNALTSAHVTVQDQLFSTLDPVTRRIRLPNGRPALLTDTVGFIQKLPTALIAAFRATLEELQGSDLLLHMVDITDPNAGEQVDVVNGILAELGLQDTPQVLALNKVDLLGPADGAAALMPNAVLVSATQGRGLDKLLATIQKALEKAGEALPEARQALNAIRAV